MAHQHPVLVDQVVGGDVGVGPAEGLLQGVGLEGVHHVVLWGREDGAAVTHLNREPCTQNRGLSDSQEDRLNKK